MEHASVSSFALRSDARADIQYGQVTRKDVMPSFLFLREEKNTRINTSAMHTVKV